MSDFEAELGLYERSGALVTHLAANWRQNNAPEGVAAAARSPAALSPVQIQDLAIDMYEHGIVEEEDVTLTRAWLKDLLSVGYKFPPPAASAAVEGAGKVAAKANPNAEEEVEWKAVFAAGDWRKDPVEVAKGRVSAKRAVAVEGSAARTSLVTTRTLAELGVTEATLGGGKDQHDQQRKVQTDAEIEMKHIDDGDKPSVLLVIAVVTIRKERREAIRNAWLAWGDDRVVLRFFTEAPDESYPEGQAEARALEQESESYGDLAVMNIERGMNFAVKLLSAMKHMSARYNFDFFLRLDDDYFLCLDRLLDELEATKRSLTGEMTLNYERQNPSLPQLMLYAGSRYCKPGETRIDEAYMLLSGALVHRVMSMKDLRCGPYAGTTVGWWFTVDHDANKDGDVRWVHDERLDHKGLLVKKMMKRIARSGPSTYQSVCQEYMGVHHAYPEEMAVLWEAAKDVPTLHLPEGNEAGSGNIARYPYLTTDTCEYTASGYGDKWLAKHKTQPCDSFHAANVHTHCGAQGC